MHPIFSAHFWFAKPGFCPLFLAKNEIFRPYKLQNFPQIGRSPLSQKQKWPQFCRFSKSVRTFFSSPNPSGLFVNQHNAAFDFEISLYNSSTENITKFVIRRCLLYLIFRIINAVYSNVAPSHWILIACSPLSIRFTIRLPRAPTTIRAGKSIFRISKSLVLLIASNNLTIRQLFNPVAECTPLVQLMVPPALINIGQNLIIEHNRPFLVVRAWK